MKFSLTFAGIVGLAAASPFSEHDNSNGLMARTGKCNWKDQHCCTYPDQYSDAYAAPKTKRSYGSGRTIYVKSGKKIQDALNKASPGDRIVVEAGTYPEQLVIDKDGIQLEGRGAILVKPSTYKRNGCTGLTQDQNKNELQAGICITGYKVKTTEYQTEHKRVISVKKPVNGVSVTGFSVKGFSGINIAVIGAKNTYVTKNKITDAGAYGALTLGSVNTVFSENTVTTTAGGFIGICQDNFSDVHTVKNDISGNFIGVCVQTNSAVIAYNKLHDNCFGVFVDPGVKDVLIAHNYIGPTPAACGKASAGIVLDGAIGTVIRDNKIEGQRGDGAGSGVLIYDESCKATPEQPISLSCIALGHAVKARDNVVIRNTFKNNDSDFNNLSKGSGNIIKCNTCDNAASIKAGQCKKA